MLPDGVANTIGRQSGNVVRARSPRDWVEMAGKKAAVLPAGVLRSIIDKD